MIKVWMIWTRRLKAAVATRLPYDLKWPVFLPVGINSGTAMPDVFGIVAEAARYCHQTRMGFLKMALYSEAIIRYAIKRSGLSYPC